MQGIFSKLNGSLSRGVILALVVLGSVSWSSSAQAENGEVLFGAAAVTAAVSAMVVPGIMSQAQTQVTQIQAQTSTQIAGMNSQAALYQARLQSDLALSQAMMARDQAFYAQQSQTRDLVGQLQFLAYNRALDAQLERDKMAQDMAFQQAYLNLENKRMVLNQILTETSMLMGGGNPALYPQATANIKSSGIMGSGALAASMGTSPSTSPTASGNNALLSSANSSYELAGIAGRGLSSGSTRNRRYLSDLSSFSASIMPSAAYQEPEGMPHASGRSLRSLASEPSRHRR